MTAESEKGTLRTRVLTVVLVSCIGIAAVSMWFDQTNVAIGAFLAISASALLMDTEEEDAS